MSKLLSNSMKFAATPGAKTFLPDEYVRRKREMRVNLISMALFAAVMAGVSGAFIVTNRAWKDVRERQQQINDDYQAEALKIDQLKKLEDQRKDMLDRAEIAAALLEKVPRSILLAEIVNRMPERMTLTELNMQSKRVAEAPPPAANNANQPKSLSVKPAAGSAQAKAGSKTEANQPKPRPPKLEFSLVITGVASADADIADFQAAMRDCPLLRGVEWRESKATTIAESNLRQFTLEAQIRPGADTRNLTPLTAKRIKPRVNPETAVEPVETADTDKTSIKVPAPAKRKGLANAPTP